MVRTARKKIMPNTPFLRCHRLAHRSRITANMCRYITHDHPLLIMGSSVLTFPLPRSGRGGWRYAPSPCGVLFLKYALQNLIREEERSFRPLAGFCFLNARCVEGKRSCITCFRPLAGFWFLNVPKLNIFLQLLFCFRPLAGFWFLNLRIRSFTLDMRECFRPLAGFWFLNSKTSLFPFLRPRNVSVPLRGSGS